MRYDWFKRFSINQFQSGLRYNQISIRIRTRIRISLWNSSEKFILYLLKMYTKFGVAPQSICENQNSVQDQDQNHDFTLDFNTRPTFHTLEDTHQIWFGSANPFESYCVHIKSPRTYIQTDRLTAIFACFVF